MPNIAINELELNNNLDGTEVFASVELGNGVTYQSRVSAVHYADSVCESQIKNSSVTNSKIANDSVNNNKIVNTDNYVVNKITTCEFALGAGKVFCTQGATANYQWPSSTPNQSNLFLTSNSNGDMSWSQTPGDGTTQTFLVNSPSTPVGTITEWVGTSPPAGWLVCNGAAISRTTYSDLFNLFNGFTTPLPYGTGDGSTTFNLPSFAGRTLIGSGQTTDSAGQLSTFSLYTSGGEFENILSYSQMPAHRHVSPFGENSNQGSFRWGNFDTSAGAGSNGGLDSDNNRYGYTTYAGGGSTENGDTTSVTSTTPHNNIQPYAVVNYIIKAESDIIVDFSPTLTGGLSALDNDGLFTSTSLDLSSRELGVYVDETKLGFCANNKLTIKDDFIVTCAEGGLNAIANDTTIPTTSAVKDYVKDYVYATQIGVGQTWQSVTRVLDGTSYTNSTGKPIMVKGIFIGTTDAHNIFITVTPSGGSPVLMYFATSTNSGGGVTSNGSIIIPNNTSYSFTKSGTGAITSFSFYELR